MKEKIWSFCIYCFDRHWFYLKNNDKYYCESCGKELQNGRKRSTKIDDSVQGGA